MADIDSRIKVITESYESSIAENEKKRDFMYNQIIEAFHKLDGFKPYIMEWYYLEGFSIRIIADRLKLSKRHVIRLKKEAEREEL